MTALLDRPVDARKPDAAVAASIWRLAVKRANPIVLLNEGDGRVPLYCVHPVTGDVVGPRGLAAGLGRHRFLGIQVPRERMTAAFGASIEGMARHYVDLVVAAQPTGPIALAGWSAGAIVALEMAQQLRAIGRDVPLLVALDGAPCNAGAGLAPWHPLYLARLIANLPRWIRDDRQQDWSWRGVARRIEMKLAVRFGVEGRRDRLANVETVDAETMQRMLDAGGWSAGQKAFVHAMYEAMIAYVPRPYDGPVVVYETRTQPLYHLRQIGAAWAKLAADVEIVPVDGNHSGLIVEPAAGRIAAHLGRCLDAATGRVA